MKSDTLFEILNQYAEPLNQVGNPWGLWAERQRERVAVVAEIAARETAGDLVEIGCLNGSTTTLLAQVARRNGRKIIAVDPHEDAAVFTNFARALAPYQDVLIYQPVSSLDQVVIDFIKACPLCFAFVDGRHDFDAARSDILTVNHAAVVVVDDLQWNAEVRQAFEQSVRISVTDSHLREGYLL